MGLRQKILCAGILLLFCTLFVAQTNAPNSTFRAGEISSLPRELLRPRYGEEPHFPRDYTIGTLGRCDASEESYRYARALVAGLAAGNVKIEETSGLNPVQFSEQKRLSVQQKIVGLGTRNWRVGGGRVEPDGSVSFLIRFLGRESSITGELYLRKNELYSEKEEEAIFWSVDDILLENPRSLSEGKFGPGGAEMTVYERFF